MMEISGDSILYCARGKKVSYYIGLTQNRTQITIVIMIDYDLKKQSHNNFRHVLAF